MTDRAIILGTFVDYRRVKGRKCLQLFVEVPLERELETLNALGAPVVGESNWVSVARLTDEAVALLQGRVAPGSTNSPVSTPRAPSDAGDKPPTGESSPPVGATNKRKFSEMPLSQQAALRCRDESFQRFLAMQSGQDDFTEEQAAADVCMRCDVASRSMIREGDKAGDYWLSIEARYQQFLVDQKYGQARR